MALKLNTQFASPQGQDRTSYDQVERATTYPNGPICVHSPYIYFSSQPTKDTVLQFDVVMNVASEVDEPLLAQDPTLDQDDMNEPKSSSNRFAKLVITGENAETKTSRALESPVYIHKLWTHTSNILNDLRELVDTIDSHVREERSILIHCSEGKNRSATLVVAYKL